ncbi:amino acid adenylation domain-containing protein [Lysinibacillus xylanilyticus]|uniref:amino acid adenylation domain-containing protein n=1 Tax=Lysinibacillus xylanilyticus TaxID=582475 RepID=UPI0037FD84F3
MKVQAAYPMTEMQSGIAYECELHKNDNVYISQALIKLGYKDLIVYKKSWENIVNKYQIFRTKFVFGNLKENVQVVIDNGLLDWNNIHISEGDLSNIIKQEKERPLSLADDCLMRFLLVNTEKNNYLIWTFHHILLDGWSMSLTLKEVNEEYKKLVNGNIEDFEQDITLSEYISWKLSNKNEKSNDFWNNYLQDFKGNKFPEIARVTVSQKFDEVKMKVSTNNELINDFCKKNKISLAVFFQTLWALVLNLYSGKEDVLFEVIDSGRSKRTNIDLNKVIGLLIESYPKRFNLTKKQSFMDLLRSTHDSDIEIREYDLISTSQAKAILNLEKNDELTNSTFVFENYPSNNSEELFEIVNGHETSTSDLTFSTGIVDHSAFMKLMFSTEVIDKSQATDILELINNWIEDIVKTSNNILIEDLLNRVQKSEIDSVETEVPKEKTFFEIISEISTESPNNIAVIDNQNTTTYRELVTLSSTIIKNLNQLSINKDESVAVLLDRNTTTIALFIALQYLGIPYTFLDSKNNSERINYILINANVALIITDDKREKTVFNSHNSLNINELLEEQNNSKESISSMYRKNSYCQLIYTSGSTGMPKGIEMTAENIISLAINNGFHSVENNDNFAQASSMAFDASIFEIWLPLLNGAKLTIIPEPVFDIHNWKNQISLYDINIAWMTSSLFNTFVDLDFSLLRNLKNIYVGGEVISPKHIKKAMAISPSTNFYNGYGPTENTTFTSTFKIPKTLDETSPIPIGNILANSSAMVVDEYYRPVPVNVPGELIVSGSGLSNGYHKKKDLTEKYFVSLNYKNQLNRWYRTGDLVYFDGQNLNYLGRKDNQIKLRGFRIELGEIENALNQVKGIEQSMVIVDNTRNEKEIIAFYVGNVELEKINCQLNDLIPTYMMPKKIIKVAKIPLTINGKADKQKLMNFVSKEDCKDKEVTISSNVLQKFEDVIKKYIMADKLDNEQSLFSYGVDSLKAVRINHELNKVFNKSISLKEFIESESIEELLLHYNGEELHKTTDKKFKNQNQQYLALASEMQESMYFFQIEHPSVTMYNIPFIRKYKHDNNIITQIKERYVDLLANNSIFSSHIEQLDNGDVTWVKSPKKNQPYFEVVFTNDKDKNDYINKELNYRFNLKDPKESLIRLSLLISENSMSLVIIAHHIIFDGSSMELLLDKLLGDGKQTHSKQSYFDYLNKIQSLDRSKNIKFWSNTLENIQPSINFPKSSSNKYNHEGKMKNYTISQTLINKITKFAQLEKSSKYLVVLSAYSQYLMRYYNQESVLVGTPVSTRNVDYQDVFGMFLSFLPIVSKESREKNFRTLIRDNKYLLFEMMDHANITYNDLQKVLKPQNQNGLSFIQTVLNYQDLTSEDQESLSGADIITDNQKFAQFPLTLTFYENLNESFIQVNFASGLFSVNQVDDLMEHFLIWLERVIDFANLPIGEVQLFNENVQQKIVKGNNPNFEIRNKRLEDYCVSLSYNNHQVAIVDSNFVITYSELRGKIDEFAENLNASGFKKGDRILYIGNRCWQQTLIFYTCLIHEYVYIPIDSNHSSSRIEDVINEVQPNLIIYSETGLSISSEYKVHIDDIFNNELKIYSECERSSTSNLAYILFTSGTTGKPKGVPISRSNLANFSATIEHDYKVQSNWKSVYLSSVSFDAAIFEMMMALVPGNTLYIFTIEHHLLPEFISKNNINFMFITPTLLNVLDFSICNSLNMVVVAGDMYRKNITLPENIRVINAYGPTEGTISISFTDNNQERTVGKPTSNSSVMILDNDSNILPNGSLGEISVIGPSVMESYLNKVDNNGRVYKVDSFLKSYGDTLYKTGDYGFFDENGCIVYCGRNDNQVKIRGLRIELSEITERLLNHPTICDAYTTITADDKRIISYVVFSENNNKQLSSIKEYLEESLPTYMVPHSIMPIKEFKLTINGKIDTKALPTPNFEEMNHIIESEITNVEKYLLKIWKEIFKSDRIGISDSFYDIGGDSIKSIQIVSRLRNDGIHVSTQEVLKNSTIKNIAKLIDKNNGIKNISSETLGEFRISPIQNWFYNLNLPVVNHWNQSTYITIENIDEKQLVDFVRKIYEDHPMLRANIKNEKNDKYIIIQDLNTIDFSKIVQRCVSKKEFLAIQETLHNCIDINMGRTSQIAYYSDSDGIHIYWVIHHLFVDAYSWEIIQRSLLNLSAHTTLNQEAVDISTNKEFVLQQSKIINNFNVKTNEQNKLFKKQANDYTFELNKSDFKNAEKLNFPLLFSSVFIQKVLEITKLDVKIIQELNSRYTDTYKMFNLNSTIGWLTEFKNITFTSDNKYQQIYAKLINGEVVNETEESDQELFLNIININDSEKTKTEFKNSNAYDIAKENLNNMPPMINIINGNETMIISVINLDNAEVLMNKTISDISSIVDLDISVDYFKHIESVGDSLIDLIDYKELKSQNSLINIYPLFPLQEDILYSSSGNSQSYVNEFKWTSKTSIEDMIQRFRNVINKFEALRTTIFRSNDNNFAQIISNPDIAFPFTVFDIRDQTIEKQKLTIDSIVDEESLNYRKPHSKHLHGFYFFRIDEENTRVVWLFNHILLDGWSVGIVLNELWNKDSVNLVSHNSNLDYVKWLTRERNYSKQNLIDDSYYPKSVGKIFGKNSKIYSTNEKSLDRQFIISEALSNDVKKYIRSNKITVAGLMNFIWGYILSNLTGSADVVFGMVDSGRECPVDHMETKVGLFIKTVISIYRNDAGKVVEQAIIENNKKMTHELIAQQPDLISLRKTLNIPVNEEVFESILVVENYPEAEATTEDIKDIEAKEQSNYPLSLSFGMGENILYKIAFNPSLIDEDEIVKIGCWIEKLLASIIEDNKLLVQELPKEEIQIRSIENVVNPKPIEQNEKKQNIIYDDVKKVWSSVLNVEKIEGNDDFFNLGGDSLKLSKMIFILKEDFNYDLDVLGFFENPTLSYFLSISNNTKLNEEIKEEVKEGEAENCQIEIEPNNFVDTNTILITGATGLLGSELVYQSLKNGKKVYCIVRGQSNESARKRVLDKINEISINTDNLDLSNLYVLNGDVTKLNFGLNTQKYDEISEEVSTIYHSAGNVNFMASLKEACDVNVEGLKRILQFSRNRRLKKVNHISTLSVVGHDHFLVEDIDIAPISYVKSKILAEKVVRSYRSNQEGLQVSRVGRIAGNSRTYSVPKQDLFWRLVTSIAEIGCCPEEFLSFETDLTPVDFIAKELINNTSSTTNNKVINYFSKCMISFGRCIEVMEKVLNRKIERVSYEEWMDRAEYDSEDNQIKVIIPLFRKNVFYEPEENTIVSENSPDKLIQTDILIEEKISDFDFERYLTNVLKEVTSSALR